RCAAAPKRDRVVAGKGVDRGVPEAAGQINEVAPGEQEIGTGNAASRRGDRVVAGAAVRIGAAAASKDKVGSGAPDLDRHAAETSVDKRGRGSSQGDRIA